MQGVIRGGQTAAGRAKQPCEQILMRKQQASDYRIEAWQGCADELRYGWLPGWLEDHSGWSDRSCLWAYYSGSAMFAV